MAAPFRKNQIIKELQCSPLTVPSPDRTNIKTNEKQAPVTELKNYRLFLSSSGKTLAYDFKENIDERMTNVEQMRVLNTTIRYTEPATSGLLHQMLFIRFKDFPSNNFKVSARTSSNFSYHFTIPTLVYTASGTVVKLNNIMPYNYNTNIGRRLNIKDIDVEVYYQDDTTGEFSLFTDLTYIGLEIEFK